MINRFIALSLAAFGLVFVSPFSFAKPVPDNLGNGLDKLVESHLILQGKMAVPSSAATTDKPTGTATVSGNRIPVYDGYATRQAANYAAHAIVDPISKNLLVDITLSGTVPLPNLQQTLTSKFGSLKITAVDAKYRGVGIIEAYVSLNDVVALSQTEGVRALRLMSKPYHSRRLARKANRARRSLAPTIAQAPLGLIGTTFDQGVTQHRVDKINQLYTPGAPVNWDGSGITIGCLSDSFDTSGSGSYSADVASKDLPGTGNSVNTQPVVVLQDSPGGTDEGRGMCQIVYKMAPGARIGFASAEGGEVTFANNIRALAGLPGFTYPVAKQKGFQADVICDDVGYFSEPYFQTGIIGQAINDVHAAGVSYFSSAGNDIGINGFDSDLHIVATADATTGGVLLKGTNCNLANVPAALYAGGFHNYTNDPNNPDFAQTVNVPNSAILAQYLALDYFLIFQWDDPLDSPNPTLGAKIFTGSGSVDGVTTTSVTFNGSSSPPLPPFTAGQEYVLTEHATSGDFDAVIDIIDPNGNTVDHQDTGVDEVMHFFPQISGQYQVKVSAFSSGPGMTTSGSFDLVINTANGQPGLTTDLNLLVFDEAGTYQGSKSLTSNNLSSNTPIDYEAIMGDNSTHLQFVVARANTPAGAHPATHFRWVMPGNGLPDLGPAEYFKYNSPTTGGHAIAAGCNGTAAYSVFRPSIPEYFTSPGPATIYFDDNGNRLTPPLIREQPSVAAADGGNTSFFSSDSIGDLDDDTNFFGTSAAAPHAAAVAGLVLHANGGSHSVTPAQMTRILHDTAFEHDLDPLTATGVVPTGDGGTITVTIHSDNEANGGPLSGIGILPGFTPPVVPVPGVPVPIPNTGTGEADPDSIRVSYTGTDSRKITNITFNPAGDAESNADPTEAGNVTGGNNGVDATNTYFSHIFPGVVFLPQSVPFTVGTSQPNTLASTDVTATPMNPAGPPSTGDAFWTLQLDFGTAATSNFVSGKALHFTIGRGEHHSSAVEDPTTGADQDPSSSSSGQTIDDATGDIWGGGVLIPEGAKFVNGMKFTVTLDDGSTISGRMLNQLGHGYTPLDGYGFINAEAATAAGLPTVQLNSVVSRKIHDTAGALDIDLPLTGDAGIECRRGGANNTYTLVFTFGTPLSSVDTPVIAGGSLVSSSIGTDRHQYIVNVKNLVNKKTMTVTLTNVNDDSGGISPTISAKMALLIGDVDGSGHVDVGDVGVVQQNNSKSATASPRADVDVSGHIDVGDIGWVQKFNSTSLE